jgi:hypothetical protein
MIDHLGSAQSDNAFHRHLVPNAMLPSPNPIQQDSVRFGSELKGRCSDGSL